MTYLIIGWCALVFIALNLPVKPTWLPDALLGFYSDRAVYNGAFWALVTNSFVHIEPLHLLFNLYWLHVLGGAFERRFGSGWFVLFVLVSAFVSSGLQLASGESGIGLSGVGYALFGFGFVARNRIHEFARIVNDQVVYTFIGWGVFCVVATALQWMNIANLAHAGGFAIGAVIGGVVAHPKLRVWFVCAAVVLSTGSVVPLFWNPLSVEWVAKKAYAAHVQKNFPSAIKMYRRALELGADQIWAWSNLARIYGFQNDQPRYKEAIGQLRTLDSIEAKEVTDAFGEPD